MSTDLSRLYNLLRYHKDVEFGPYAGMSTIMSIQYDIRRWLNNRIDDETLKTVFNKMEETIKEMGIKEDMADGKGAQHTRGKWARVWQASQERV